MLRCVVCSTLSGMYKKGCNHTGATCTQLPLPLPVQEAQTHRCTMTLFFSPPASIVTLSSSSVLLGKVVPIVYGRCSLAGRELNEMRNQCHVSLREYKTDSTQRRKELLYARIDEAADIANGMGEVHSTDKSVQFRSVHGCRISRLR